jgi:hypothetical protein
MPLRWTISPSDRLVVATAEGPVGLKDIEAYLDDVVVSGALPFRKIFDTGTGSSLLSNDDMMALAARIRAYGGAADMGPLAIVASSDEVYAIAQTYMALGEGRRPMKLFRDVAKAREWLDGL